MSPPTKKKALVELGRVGKPSGLQGGFWVVGRTQPLPAGLKVLWIGPDPNDVVALEVTKQEFRNGRVMIRGRQFPNREAVEVLRGAIIWGEASQLTIDRESEYLWQELIGLRVVDSNGTEVGFLQDIYNAGASDIAVIKRADGYCAEMPLVSSYFDLSFLEPPAFMRLTVDHLVLEELWYHG